MLLKLHIQSPTLLFHFHGVNVHFFYTISFSVIKSINEVSLLSPELSFKMLIPILHTLIHIYTWWQICRDFYMTKSCCMVTFNFRYVKCEKKMCLKISEILNLQNIWRKNCLTDLLLRIKNCLIIMLLAKYILSLILTINIYIPLENI